MSKPLFDCDALLAPLDGDSPVGVDMRDDTSPTSLYYEIKNHRSQARDIERRRDFGEKVDSPGVHWQGVVDGCVEVLSGQSKDLEVATYLIEASLRTGGFSGLRDAFRVAAGLVDQYWDDLFPRPSEAEPQARLSQFYGLNGRGTGGVLPQAILLSPITDSKDHGPFGTSDYIQAQELSKLSDQQFQRRLRRGAVSLKMVRSAVNETSKDFFRQLRTDLRECMAAFDELTAVLQEKGGPDAPHSSNIRQAMESCQQSLTYLVGPEEMPIEPEAEVEDDEQVEDVTDQDSPMSEAPAQKIGPIKNRDEALRVLALVADFYRRSEPHSPMSYACDQLVRWGNMSLVELAAELIPDPNSRNYFKMRIGAQGGGGE